MKHTISDSEIIEVIAAGGPPPKGITAEETLRLFKTLFAEINLNGTETPLKIVAELSRVRDVCSERPEDSLISGFIDKEWPNLIPLMQILSRHKI